MARAAAIQGYVGIATLALPLLFALRSRWLLVAVLLLAAEGAFVWYHRCRFLPRLIEVRDTQGNLPALEMAQRLHHWLLWPEALGLIAAIVFEILPYARW